MTHDMDKSFEFYDLKKATFNKSDFNDFEEFRLGLRNKEEAKVMRDSEFITNAKANTEAEQTISAASSRARTAGTPGFAKLAPLASAASITALTKPPR